MKTNSRDNLLKIILPALAIVIFYGMYSAVGQHKQIAKLSAEVVKARAKQVSDVQFQVQQRKLAAAKKDTDKAQAERKDWDGQWRAATGPCLDHDKRSYRQSKLLSLLKGNKVRVLDHGKQDGVRGSTLKLSVPQEKLAKLMAARGDQKTPLVLRLQVRAKYADLSRALLSLSSGEPLAIPLAVVMKEDPFVSESRGAHVKKDKGQIVRIYNKPSDPKKMRIAALTANHERKLFQLSIATLPGPVQNTKTRERIELLTSRACDLIEKHGLDEARTILQEIDQMLENMYLNQKRFREKAEKLGVRFSTPIDTSLQERNFRLQEAIELGFFIMQPNGGGLGATEGEPHEWLVLFWI